MTFFPQDETVSHIFIKVSSVFIGYHLSARSHLATFLFQKLTSTIAGRAVIAGISWVSSRPHENVERSWGRHLATTRTTESLPKLFQIEGRQPPNLCAVEVDVDPLDIYEIDTFRLSDLVTAGSAVYWGCLMNQAKIGV